LEGQRAALVEIYLLSLCDEIVTTQMSTFSYVAHALASKVFSIPVLSSHAPELWAHHTDHHILFSRGGDLLLVNLALKHPAFRFRTL